MSDDSHLYLDAHDLKARGWTESLVRRFLGDADQMLPVNHWANFQGKRAFFLERIENAERNSDFDKTFRASIKRRRIEQKGLRQFLKQRTRTKGWVRAWRESLTGQDIRRLKIVARAAAPLEDARRKGYRTPHKG